MLSDGFEEVEALTPLDMIRRAGFDIKTVGISGKIVTGSHKIPVIADYTPADVNEDAVSLVILPGGMPGTTGLDASPFVNDLLKKVYDKGGRLAAICAAPSVLGKRGYLNGKHAVCYPGFEKELKGATVENAAVVTDGKITTAQGMGAAFAFGYELVNILAGKETADRIALSTMPEKLPGSILRF